MAVMGDVEHITLEQLAEIPIPEATPTWNPIGHSRVMDMVMDTLDGMRFEVKDMDLTVAKEGQRFFGTLDLATGITDGVTLAVGVRNAVDKSFSLGFCCGERVMVCSNLCFGGEINITRKHTQNAEDDFHVQVIKACQQLRQYRNLSEERIGRLRRWTLSDNEADALLLRAFEQDVVGARMLRPLIREWREPSYEEFVDRNRYSMLMAYTHLMKDRFQKLPYQAANETMGFQQFLAV